MPKKLKNEDIEIQEEVDEPSPPVVKPKKKMSEKQLEILRQGRLKAIERRKEISKELDLKNRTKILKEEKAKKIQDNNEKIKKEYQEAKEEVFHKTEQKKEEKPAKPKSKGKVVKIVKYINKDSDSSSTDSDDGEHIVYKKASKGHKKREKSHKELVEKSSTDLLKEKLRNDQMNTLRELLRPQ